ncbi:pentapeptide repeat-containing protein [Salmonella enterica subsp. enterica]|uniref:Pentapeptide repeat-containing protein n=1 Tax=Salmonella enterica TaxID=28901 RepID=A0A5Y8LZB4_SALER|nr:pentapeptide repeat-containing protein [Salmonella enterica subsp. enterica serovar Tennessee]EBI4685734.1 pentapeptide repeat-containing protein [Salmonella enterica]EDL1831985.1 pentapeptide repeat-containing protein [Salmonella enterica subsp. enterica serovar Montevideo]EJY7324803.1 pentapeptide repeat-containing protein [Salmonella enterica subsp. enterica serovar Braenderup]EBK1871040.1 pentapeptide repeat-containing protein [Salmonella enterica subsp. enterica serovar Tennessee]
MNSADLSKILEEHKVWITSMRESGSRADLRDADLFGANLCGADLRGADLRDADLFGADLLGANLRGANLRDADLRGANLCGANLRDADLRGANLCGADLPDLTFVILGEKYFISITNGEYVRAGCQNHTVEEWRKYSKQEIAEMDGRKALKFYPRLLDIIDFYIGKGERPDWLTSKEYADEVTE